MCFLQFGSNSLYQLILLFGNGLLLHTISYHNISYIRSRAHGRRLYSKQSVKNTALWSLAGQQHGAHNPSFLFFPKIHHAMLRPALCPHRCCNQHGQPQCSLPLRPLHPLTLRRPSACPAAAATAPVMAPQTCGAPRGDNKDGGSRGESGERVADGAGSAVRNAGKSFSTSWG